MRWQPRFTVSSILLATLWMAACFGIWAMIREMHRQHASNPAEVPLTWAMMICPFIAVGALFRKSLWGLIVGVLAVGTFWGIFYLT
jgi:hypothetical protein